MSKFAEPMARLIDELKKLPGIGSKTAQRLAFHILRSSDDDAEALAAAVRDVKANLRLCSICNNITDVDPCVYCSSATRNQRMVCVVEEPTNIAAIEKTKHFNGVYHVLHGSISPLARSRSGAVADFQPDAARGRRAGGRSHHRHQSHRRRRSHRDLSFRATAARGLKVTRIAMGIPVGSDIEYADEITMLKGHGRPPRVVSWRSHSKLDATRNRANQPGFLFDLQVSDQTLGTETRLRQPSELSNSARKKAVP